MPSPDAGNRKEFRDHNNNASARFWGFGTANALRDFASRFRAFSRSGVELFVVRAGMAGNLAGHSLVVMLNRRGEALLLDTTTVAASNGGTLLRVETQQWSGVANQQALRARLEAHARTFGVDAENLALVSIARRLDPAAVGKVIAAGLFWEAVSAAGLVAFQLTGPNSFDKSGFFMNCNNMTTNITSASGLSVDWDDVGMDGPRLEWGLCTRLGPARF